MRSSSCIPAAVLLAATVALDSRAARADVDATGTWVVTAMPGIVPDVTVVRHWVQSGPTLSTDDGFSGSIDPSTGSFTLTRPFAFPIFNCPDDQLFGTVAADGRTFTATEVDHFAGSPTMCEFGFDYPVIGSRCGDGTVGTNEPCDDGNAANGDGCSADCQVELCFQCAGNPSVCAPLADGSACDDGNPCTTTACDAGGTCIVTSTASNCVYATGTWYVRLTGDPALLAIEHWVQMGTALSSDSGFQGTIDSFTGAFSMSRPSAAPICPDTLTGTVALGGQTWTATELRHPLAVPLCSVTQSSPLSGTRCGGGTLDPDEQCDDGNNANFDGCDRDCHVEPCFVCSGEPSLCTPAPAGTSCGAQGNACTTAACNGGGTCVVSSVDCDDAQPCTLDSCDPGLGCLHAADVRPCRSARSASLLVRHGGDDSKDKLVWKWLKGQAPSQAEFAPGATPAYTFCLFAGAAAAVSADAQIPPDAHLWTALGGGGYKFKDKSAAYGIGSLVLSAGSTDRARIVLKGNGAALSIAAVPLDVPLTAQLTNDDTNVCWSATYGAGDVLSNAGGMLKAEFKLP